VGDPVTKVILAESIAQVDAPSGLRYGGNMPGRVFDMTPSDARAVVKLGGALASESGTTRRSLGYRCPDCDFGSFVLVCSRCGGTCERE
jgi:hypothetical protein